MRRNYRFYNFSKRFFYKNIFEFDESRGASSNRDPRDDRVSHFREERKGKKKMKRASLVNYLSAFAIPIRRLLPFLETKRNETNRVNFNRLLRVPQLGVNLLPKKAYLNLS